MNWGPTASRQHRSRGLRHRQGRNLNCGATRKCSRPVDGRRPQTFDPPGRLLGSAAQDLLAQPASLGDRACCLQTTAPSKTARPIAAGCGSVGGLARLFSSRSASSIPNSGQQGQIDPICRGRSRRFRPAIGPLQSATAQTAVPRRWRAAAATADPACNVIRLSPAARRRTRAPASRSAIKRTIGSGCATSIAAASVIGSLIGHSARGVNNNNRKISPATTQVGRPVRPYCFGAQKDPRGRGSRLAFGLAGQPWRCLQWLGSCGLPWPALPEAFAAAPPHCAACRRPNRT